MNAPRRKLIPAVLGLAALFAMPLAQADHRGYDRYDRYERHDRYHHHDRGHHRGHHKRKVTINNYYYGDYCPPRRVEHHVYHERPRYRERVVIERHAAPYPYHRSSGEYRSATPMILGGIVGGLIGHEMGKGRGKDVATAAGVILGGSIGRDMAHDY